MFSVAMVSAHEEVTTIVGQEVVFGPLASTKSPPRDIYLKTYRNFSPMLRTLILSPSTRDSFRVTVAHVLEVDKKVLICSSGYNSGNDGRTSCTGCDPIKTL